jgi:2-dehydro-3-deoxyphosphooctonate aldolase (KDO 8-P synthase)
MKKKMIVLAGPCVVESKEMLRQTVEHLLEIKNKLDFQFIFKSSYKKANRTSVDSFTGIGDDKALCYLNEIKKEYGVEVITDVHTVEEAKKAAEYVDYLQIPAFLSRQTELLTAAGETGKTINIKKAQFMAPEDMKKAAAKVESTGNKKIFLTERGTSFGYHDLVVDFRSLIMMQDYGYPVIYDATHSLQKPSIGAQSGGLPQFIPPLARAAVATGIDGVFFETHPEPEKAKSDAATQLKLEKSEDLLRSLTEVYDLVRKDK